MCAFITTFKVHNYSNIIEEMKNIEIKKDLPSFESIFKAVIPSEDDHDAKTVFALHH